MRTPLLALLLLSALVQAAAGQESRKATPMTPEQFYDRHPPESWERLERGHREWELLVGLPYAEAHSEMLRRLDTGLMSPAEAAATVRALRQRATGEELQSVAEADVQRMSPILRQ